MTTLSGWNGRQGLVLERYCRVRTMELTPELAIRLAGRFAEKHAGERGFGAGDRGRRDAAEAPAGQTGDDRADGAGRWNRPFIPSHFSMG